MSDDSINIPLMLAIILTVIFLVASVLNAMDRAAARRRASLEPVVLLPRAIGIPSAHRKRIGWWM